MLRFGRGMDGSEHQPRSPNRPNSKQWQQHQQQPDGERMAPSPAPASSPVVSSTLTWLGGMMSPSSPVAHGAAVLAKPPVSEAQASSWRLVGSPGFSPGFSQGAVAVSDAEMAATLHAGGEMLLHACLGSGTVFGEEALLESKSRSATVTATTSVTLLTLNRQTFNKLLGPLGDILEREAAAQQREAERLAQPRLPLSKLTRRATLTGAPTGLSSRVARSYVVEHTPSQRAFHLTLVDRAAAVRDKCASRIVTELRVLERCGGAPGLPKLIACYAAPCTEGQAPAEGRFGRLVELPLGGDLLGVLERSGSGALQLEAVRFYALSVAAVLTFLHSNLVLFRNLKPEAVMLDADGFVMLTDFGLAKLLKTSSEKAWTLCGTPHYLSPEAITSQGHGGAADWWALGVLVYELLTGAPPFGDAADDAMATYKAILHAKLTFPRRLAKSPREMIERLLTRDPSLRLGSGGRGGENVAQHTFLRSLSAAAIERREVRPPHTPALQGSTDLSNLQGLAHDAAGESARSLFEDTAPRTKLELKNREKFEFETLTRAFTTSSAAVGGKLSA